MSGGWFWIVVALLGVVGLGSWQAYLLSQRTRARSRTTVRARRAERWRRRRGDPDAAPEQERPHDS
jgi:hypothetical protein